LQQSEFSVYLEFVHFHSFDSKLPRKKKKMSWDYCRSIANEFKTYIALGSATFMLYPPDIIFYPFRSTPEGLQGIIPLFHQLKNPLYLSIMRPLV
jgi:hypothetical protein